MTTTIYIAKNVYGGDGLGRLGDGRVAFVAGAWAGESVKAEIFEEKRHYVKARLVEVVEPSADRLATPDPAVPGMVYAGLSYAAERRAKIEQLRDFFERARIPIPEVSAPFESTPRNYRNKVVYHFARQRGNWVIGYRTEPSHEIVDVTDDPLAAPEINARLGEIRKAILTLLTTGPEAVRRDVAANGIVTVRFAPRSGVKWWIGAPEANVILKEETCGRVFEVPADGFYQVNPRVGDRLVKDVVDAYVAGADAAPDVLDLYCGVGVFGVCCRLAAPGAPGRLVGVESGRQAVAFAERNAAAAGLKNASFHVEQVGHVTRRLPLGSRTTVIVDPPRGGMEPNVARTLVIAKAPRIFYVSCDPATLIRDIRILAQAYDVESVKWYDMFPRTARFETFVALRRRGKDK